MKTIGSKCPDFSLKGVAGGKTADFSLKSFKNKWLILFFYPKDFTFICPTEVKSFNAHLAQFRVANCEIAGVSVDKVETHEEWIKELGGISYPLLSDPDFEFSRTMGVFNESEKVAHRANFVIHPSGEIQYAVAYHANVGRSVEETLRVVTALQTGKLCPADWKPGEEAGDLTQNRY